MRPVCKYKTYISYAGAVNRYIAPALGGSEVAQLDGVILQKFVACLVMRGSDGAGRRLSTSTVNLIITVMQSSLKCALMAGKTATYAADNVKRPRVIEKDTQCFTSREQAAIEGEILRCGRTNLHGIIICLYTGLRIGELTLNRYVHSFMDGKRKMMNRLGEVSALPKFYAAH